MRFSDDAWRLYRDQFLLADEQRAGIEQGMAAEHTLFLRMAGGDRVLATGLLLLYTATSMARDLGISVECQLQLIEQYAPSSAAREHMRTALDKAQRYLAACSEVGQ